MDSRGYSEIAGFFLPGNGKHPASKRKANRKHQHSKMGGRHGGRPLKIFPYFFPLQLFRQLSRIYCKSGKLRENRRFLVCNLRPFPRCAQFKSRHSDHNKRSKKIFGEKTKSFQRLRGPWIAKIQGPQNLDFSPASIHSGTT